MISRTSWPSARSAPGSDPATSASPPTLTNGSASAARNRILTAVELLRSEIQVHARRGRPPGIEEDRPGDDLFRQQDSRLHPGVLVEERAGMRFVANVHDDEGASVLPVGPGEDDPPFLEDPVHEGGVLVPERLLACRKAGDPRRPRL